MPIKGNGNSLKKYRVTGDYASTNGKVERFVLEVLACNLPGAVGRGARLGRKEIKGKFTSATVTAEVIAMNDEVKG